jgi:hypothetical protein
MGPSSVASVYLLETYVLGLYMKYSTHRTSLTIVAANIDLVYIYSFAS